jgi:hypothetical protein
MGEPRWRVGRTLGRTIYLDDECVGMVDEPRLAEGIVAAMNGASIDASSHLLARMRALEAVAEQARGMLIGLEHKEQTNPHDGMWLSYRTLLTEALAALDKVPR